ncbi:hypothetical protein RCH18_003289, partial [Flavobacterium sp. PL11]|nr:hypothetical protein [Flavobacterium sp. PL11]
PFLSSYASSKLVNIYFYLPKPPRLQANFVRIGKELLR